MTLLSLFSWLQYFLFVIALGLLYYAYVLGKYYRREIGILLFGKKEGRGIEKKN